jgi:hypothetical protein
MDKCNLTLLAVSLLLMNTNIFAQDKKRSGQLVQQTSLFEKADLHSGVLAQLAEKEQIIVRSRHRAWYFISQDEETKKRPLTGWVSMLSVRFLAQAKREGELGFTDALSSMSKGSLPTVSTGVRGFDDNDLEKSNANFDQIERLNSFVASKESAKLFAQEGNLLSNSIRKGVSK